MVRKTREDLGDSKNQCHCHLFILQAVKVVLRVEEKYFAGLDFLCIFVKQFSQEISTRKCSLKSVSRKQVFSYFHPTAQEKKNAQTPVVFTLKALLTRQTGAGLCNGQRKQRGWGLDARVSPCKRKLNLIAPLLRKGQLRITCSGWHSVLAKLFLFPVLWPLLLE